MTQRGCEHTATPKNTVRVDLATVTQEIHMPADVTFNAFTRLAGYDRWAPSVQGPAHWLLTREGGVGSKFVAYDKPGLRHLTHFGEVLRFERDRAFGWSAPFSEWPRASFGSDVEFIATHSGGVRLQERMYLEADEDDVSIINGFAKTDGLDPATFDRFLGMRLDGFSRMLRNHEPSDDDLEFLFGESRIVAADWDGRMSEGPWVRILYADGLLEFDAPPDVVFNAFTRFSRYREWTPMIHVGQEWLDVQPGGVGSKFLLWEKPGERQVMHVGVVTEMVRNELFSWRAPFAEWSKVMLGTSVRLEPKASGGVRAYHVLYIDLPEEYLPVFAGFGSLRGFDIEFETFHIYEEARGFQALLRAGAFDETQRRYLFDSPQTQARSLPLQHGRRWPPETLTIVPSRVLTYEDAVVEIADRVATMVPPPSFFRTYRDSARTHRFHPELTNA